MSLFSQLFPFLPFARYALTPPSPADGELVELQGTVSGALKVAIVESSVAIEGTVIPNTWDRYKAGKHRVVHAGAATVVDVVITNEAADTRWVMFFDASSAPADDVPPVDAFRVPAGGTASFSLTGGWAFAVGIVWGCSTATGTYSETSTTEDVRVTVTYRTP